MKQTGKGPKAHTKAAQVHGGTRDRKSGTGMTGSPKKGGHGGKFTWAGDHGLMSEPAVAVVDAKDPNFEDPQSENENDDSLTP